jgi:hypothetical protein
MTCAGQASTSTVPLLAGWADTAPWVGSACRPAGRALQLKDAATGARQMTPTQPHEGIVRPTGPARPHRTYHQARTTCRPRRIETTDRGTGQLGMIIMTRFWSQMSLPARKIRRRMAGCATAVAALVAVSVLAISAGSAIQPHATSRSARVPESAVSRPAVGGRLATIGTTPTRKAPSSTVRTPPAARRAVPAGAEQVVPVSSEPLPPPPGSDPLAACSTPANGTANPATQQEFVTRIVGTWLVCSQPTFFGTAELGVQITSDGHWAKLLRNSAGQLVASSGDRDEGTWKVVDVSDMNGGPTYQLNFVIPVIGRTVMSIPTFAKSVTRMYLDNEGVYAANYVPTSEQVVPAN